MNVFHSTSGVPDRQAALAQYRRRADVYDFELQLIEPVRRRAIATLAPRSGETVFDVGCGTGMSLEMLREAVGPKGHVIGIEQSPEMIAKARERVAQRRWTNVELICAPAELAPITKLADAALFHFTHDIVRRAEALSHIARHMIPGARIVSSGLKWAPPWAVLTNCFVLPAALHSITSFEGLREPWTHLARITQALQIETLLAGGAYIALGRLAAAQSAGLLGTSSDA